MSKGCVISFGTITITILSFGDWIPRGNSLCQTQGFQPLPKKKVASSHYRVQRLPPRGRLNCDGHLAFFFLGGGKRAGQGWMWRALRCFLCGTTPKHSINIYMDHLCVVSLCLHIFIYIYNYMCVCALCACVYDAWVLVCALVLWSECKSPLGCPWYLLIR